MTSSLRLVAIWLTLFVAGATVAQAQNIYIRPFTVTSACAGSSFAFNVDVSANAPNGSLLTDLYLYNTAYADSAKLAYTSTYRPDLGRYAFIIITTIPQDRLTGTYVLQFGLLYNGRYIYTSQKSDPLRVNALPPSPTVRAISVCQNSTAPPITSAVTASSGTLKWYSPTGAPLAAAPVLSTSAVGTTNYYVTQTNQYGCESLPTSLTVIIIPRPNPPTVLLPAPYCQLAPAVSLSAVPQTGNVLRWYSDATGGIASSVAPQPSTQNPGVTRYYVS